MLLLLFPEECRTRLPHLSSSAFCALDSVDSVSSVCLMNFNIVHGRPFYLFRFHELSLWVSSPHTSYGRTSPNKFYKSSSSLHQAQTFSHFRVIYPIHNFVDIIYHDPASSNRKIGEENLTIAQSLHNIYDYFNFKCQLDNPF